MALKAVLFDMDGVIVDSEPLHRKAFHRVFEDLNIHVPQEMYYSFSGAATRHIAERLTDLFALRVSPEWIMEAKRKYFRELFYNDTEFDLLPGVRELIGHYHKQGIRLVVASSATRNTIAMVFDRFGLDPYFTARISGADLKASKPDPEIFIRAAELAGEPRENCMVIEDATNGILAAHRAGIFCAAFKSPHTHLQDYTLANLVVSDYRELWVDNINVYFR
ncbi:HAD family hydrolase [Leadbetterella sp. DM7]|uniref:HAD family hydrolase n=1 Tax=Leadbetterella sp. DM7 TaxID=3235085 RepID=UPI00349E7C32